MSNVTINDIADAAMVSKSTVSRVLNGTAEVSADKKQAVLEAVRRLGFQPSVIARSLSSGTSMTIGVMTQLIGSSFYDSISQGVISGLTGSGYSPIFVDGQWQELESVDGIRALLGRRVDGLIMIGGNVPRDAVAELGGNLPVIFVARHFDGHQSVSMDNVKASGEAVKFLAENGHRRIVLVQGLPHHPDAIARLQGYRLALEEVGLPCDEDLILDGDFTSDAGIRAVKKLLAAGTDFTAIFAANDRTAFGVTLALTQAGLRVPEDVSVVGFDDQLEAQYMVPPLTTVRQPGREMGEMAARAILSKLNDEEPELKTLQGELIIRDSVTVARKP